MSRRSSSYIFFFNDTATTEIYTLSLHDALPILTEPDFWNDNMAAQKTSQELNELKLTYQTFHDMQELSDETELDRKSTRLNSSHANISYAVFCLKKKKNILRRALRADVWIRVPI